MHWQDMRLMTSIAITYPVMPLILPLTTKTRSVMVWRPNRWVAAIRVPVWYLICSAWITTIKTNIIWVAVSVWMAVPVFSKIIVGVASGRYLPHGVWLRKALWTLSRIGWLTWRYVLLMVWMVLFLLTISDTEDWAVWPMDIWNSRALFSRNLRTMICNGKPTITWI